MKPTTKHFDDLRNIINNSTGATCKENGSILDQNANKEPMKWRKVDGYHIKSNKGFTISKASGVYTCWAPARYRIDGVKVHTGYLGFFWTRNGKAAVEACQKLFTDPQNFVPPQDGWTHRPNSGAVERVRQDPSGPVRVHRHLGTEAESDTGHPDLFAQ